MRTTRLLSFIVSFAATFALSLVGAIAVQQSAPSLSVELEPGQSTIVTWALFSDHDYETTLQISAGGDGYQFLSFDPTLRLPAGGAVYSEIRVSIPEMTEEMRRNYTGPRTFTMNPKMRAIETIQYEGLLNYVGGVNKTLSIVVNVPVTNITQETTTTVQETTATQTTSETTTQVTATMTTENFTTTAPHPGEPIVYTTATGEQIVYTATNVVPPATLVEYTDEEIEEFGKIFRKTASEIEEFKESVKTNRIGSFNIHDFDLTKGSLSKIEFELARKVSNIQIIVNTLAITRSEIVQLPTGQVTERTVSSETTPSGVVSTPSTIVPEESIPAGERNIFIETASGVRLPDIEQQTVSEEVVAKTPKGEVIRKITKRKAYKYLEINLEGASTEDVQKATIDFNVEKSWFTANGIADPSLIRLNRFAGEWVELPTKQTQEDAENYYFSAESTGFSFFVITAAITADITTPISIEVPEVKQQTGEQEDFVGDILGTSRPQPILIFNISWILVVAVLGIVVLLKYNDIKRALSYTHAKADKIKELDAEKKRYEKMKDETTKRFYKRIISEDEFKDLVKEYDGQIIKLETEIAELKGKKK